MIIVEIILVGLLLGLLSGGSLRNLAQEKLTGEWVLLLLLPTQAAWPAVSAHFGLERELSIIIWLAMMASLAVTLMLNARRRWMLAFAALGIVSNILVIGLNQAMPVDIMAASEIGSTRREARSAMASDGLHEEMGETTRLPFLADVIAVPGPTWHRGVLSAGDVLLAVGLAGWVLVACRSPA
ncbi:MAG: hypothetical protein EG823_09380 [Actinobacteria bacterium]|nr:hypothetical protein [Actinomycetota bacterium]